MSRVLPWVTSSSLLCQVQAGLCLALPLSPSKEPSGRCVGPCEQLLGSSTQVLTSRCSVMLGAAASERREIGWDMWWGWRGAGPLVWEHLGWPKGWAGLTSPLDPGSRLESCLGHLERLNWCRLLRAEHHGSMQSELCPGSCQG